MSAIVPPNPLANQTAGFYNAFVSALKLDPSQFQMIQGATPVPSDPAGLYDLFDGVPPQSAVQYYTANPLNKFSGNYLNLLVSQSASLQNKLAQNAYMNNSNWLDSNGNAPGNAGINPTYKPTFSSIQSQVASGSSIQFTFDSSSSNTSLSNTWAKNADGAGVNFWGRSSSSTDTKLNSQAASSRVVVTLTLHQYAMVPIQFGAWYFPAEASLAYNTLGNWITGPGAVTWASMFGPTGDTQNVSTEVLLTNGYTFTIQSFGSYSSSDLSYLNSTSNVNVWPFYTKSSSSGTSQGYTLNADSSITITVTCAPGNYQIMGFDVVPTSTLL